MNLLFNKSIAGAILGVPPHKIKRVEEWENCVYVQGTRISRFVSKKKFMQAFVSLRKARAESLLVREISNNRFRVFNPENGNQYTVEFYDGKFICECEDYRNQVAFGMGGKCKHIYAVEEAKWKN